MEEGKRDLLTSHLDAALHGGSLPAAEDLIRQQPEAQEEWEYLNLAVEAIRHQGLVQQVAAIREEFALAEKKKHAVPLKRYVQAAAVVMVLLGAATVYKFASVSGKRIYDHHYIAYELPVSRGEAGAINQALVLAYQQKNWPEVISLYNKTTVKDAKALFLSGMADLELHQYPDAIQKFENLLQPDLQTGGDYFHDEAEYYLALAYLANNENAKAIQLIEKIKASAGHLYAGKVRELSGLDLTILEYKTKKK